MEIDSETGTFVLTTPRTCGGFVEKGGLKAGPLTVSLDSSATVWASSLDGADLGHSARILVTHLTDLQNSGIRYRDAARTILEDWGHLPYLMRKGRAEIELSVEPGNWTVRALDASGRVTGEIPAAYRDGKLAFAACVDRDSKNATCLYEARRELRR